MRKKRILLTGATGFLGSHIARSFCRDYDLYCLKRQTSDLSRLGDAKDLCRWIDVSDFDAGSFFDANEIDAVLHCATNYGRDKNQCFDAINADLILPLTLLEKSNGKVGLFVNTDSFFAKGLNCKIDESAYLWTYTISKSFFSTFAKKNSFMFSFPFVNLCLEHVYGEDEGKGKFVNFVMSSLIGNAERIELTEGIQERDFIYVEDVVSAFRTVLEKQDSLYKGEFYNFEVGTGKSTSVRRFVELIKELTESSTELVFGSRPMNYGELMSSKADNADLKKLGWSPEYTLEAGIKKMIEESRK